MLSLGDVIPNFTVESTCGTINFHQAIEGYSAVLITHPGAFTPVCTTELGKLQEYMHEFERRGVRLFSLTTSPLDDLNMWLRDIEAVTGYRPSYPLMADPDKSVCRQLGVLEPLAGGAGEQASRTVMFIGPDKKLKIEIVYPGSVGRSTSEIFRVLDAMKLTMTYPVAIPCAWKPGDEVVISPKLSDQEVREKFPDHRVVDLPSGKNYLKFAPSPAV